MQNRAMSRSAPYQQVGEDGSSRAHGSGWPPVRLASTANLAGTYSATEQRLTVTATGALSVDSVAVAVGDRILLKDQSTAAQKGVFQVLVAGTTGVHPVLI